MCNVTLENALRLIREASASGDTDDSLKIDFEPSDLQLLADLAFTLERLGYEPQLTGRQGELTATRRHRFALTA